MLRTIVVAMFPEHSSFQSPACQSTVSNRGQQRDEEAIAPRHNFRACLVQPHPVLASTCICKRCTEQIGHLSEQSPYDYDYRSHQYNETS